MAVFADRRQLPYTPEQLFLVAADVEHYPEFLPWVSAIRVVERAPTVLLVDLVVGFMGFSERYRSRVTLDPPHGLAISYVDGPMKHLTSHWQFESDNAGGCHVQFDVDFQFRSHVLNMLANQMLDRAVHKMVNAFEARARALYGSPNGDASGINNSSAHKAA